MKIYMKTKQFNYNSKYKNWDMFTPNTFYKKIHNIVAVLFISVSIFLIAIITMQDIPELFKLNEKKFTSLILFFFIFIITYLATIIFHELLHIVAFPYKLDSERVIFLKKGKLSCLYNGTITKNRQILVLLFPFLIISILNLSGIFTFDYNYIQYFLKLSFIINISSSQKDVANSIYLYFAYPKKTLLYADKYYKIQADKIGVNYYEETN